MSKNINRYCVYEYYESEDAKNPYYVGEGVTNSRPYGRHRVASTLTNQLKERPHRFSEKLTEIIKSGDLVPKDLLLIKIVKKDLTKMEACLEETKLIERYGRITKLICYPEYSLVNIQPGFDKYMLKLLKKNPDIIGRLNEAYELAIEKDNKTYRIESSDDAYRLLENYSGIDLFGNRIVEEYKEQKERIRKEKKQKKKQKTTVNRRKKLNFHLNHSIEHAKKYPHEEYTNHQIKLIEKLYGLIKKVK